MITPQNLLVFGATGGTGRQVVAQALAAGHRVTALMRNPAAFTEQHPALTVVAGDVLEPGSFRHLLPGHDAVLSCLGGPSRGATTVYSEGTRHIGTAMEKAGVRRLLCLSAGAVEVPARASWLVRLMTRYILQRLFGELYADMLRMERWLPGSGLDWTIVRPPRLVNGPRTGHYRVALNQPLPNPGKLARADLADYLLQHLTDTATYRATVELAY